MANTVPYSASLRVKDQLFISGQIGRIPEKGLLANESFEAEVKQVMENLHTQLKAHQLTFDNLVSTVIYLKDMKNYDLLNKVYGSFFNDKFPTRTCIAVADLPAGASVEISGIATF